jgi:SAM-dependent methyltransferase
LDPTYGERYRELYEKHWWWRARTKLITATLDRLRPAQGWENILDIGCGDGLYFGHLAQLGQVEGIEPSSALVSADNPYRDRIHLCPFDQNFRPGKRYSLVLMLDVLEHLQDPAAALRQVSELLTSEGRFVATVPAFMSLWTSHDDLNHHFTRYTKARLVALAGQNGLEVKEALYFYHWTCPLKLGIALFERVFRPKPEPATIPALWVNRMSYLISRLEQKTLSRLAMPFGSSLMIVAQRRREGKSSA